MIVACVRTGDKYPIGYVTRLRNMVERHMPIGYEMVCLTDQKERCSGVTFIDITASGLTGWWAKMLLFEPQWRRLRRVIYLDLDVIVRGDLSPITLIQSELAILASPVRTINGNAQYPCAYNSSVMVIRETMTDFIWRTFDRDRERWMRAAGNYGDQLAIELIYGGTADLIDRLLPGFVLNYRLLTMIEPSASIITFGGKNKPDTCQIPWVTKLWA